MTKNRKTVMGNLTDTVGLLDGEHIEDIGSGLRLIVSGEHTFGTDALLLADFSLPMKNDTACDLGTGCGIIPFYWKRAEKAKQIYAVDIQPKAYEQLERSVKMGSVGSITPVLSDLTELKGKVPFGSFDVVSMNPPYTADGAGIQSSSLSAKIARHETACSLEDICRSASKLLKFGGRLCMCIRPARLFELSEAMKNAKIEPKRLRLVSQRADTRPWLALLEGKLGRRPGLEVMTQMSIENPDGTMSAEMLKIIGAYSNRRSEEQNVK